MMASGTYDLEDLLKAKSFADLDADELAFVMQHVDDEEEYERIRRMLPLFSAESDPGLEASPSFREQLMQAAESRSKNESKIIPLAWYRQRWVLAAVTGIAATFLIAMVWFFRNNTDNIIRTDQVVKVEEITPAVPENRGKSSGTASEEPKPESEEAGIPEGVTVNEEPGPVADQRAEYAEDIELRDQKDDIADAVTFTPVTGATSAAWSGNAVPVQTDTKGTYSFSAYNDFSTVPSYTGNAITVPTTISTDSLSVSFQGSSSNQILVEQSTGEELKALDAVAVRATSSRTASSAESGKGRVKKVAESRPASRSLSADLDLLPLLYRVKGN